jgi:carbon starvation protein
MLVGYFLYHLRVNSLLATLFGLLCLTALICWGNILGINAGIKVWLLILLVYCYFASVLPVNLLLQPRDYLSSFLLFFGIAAGYVGLLISHPNINIPPYQGCNSAEGYLWPALFVTVACGAVSGFHAIIASGTTSKQVANERQIKRIGYGAMIAEGLVAVLAIISTGVLFQSFSGAFGMQGNFAALLKSVGPIDIFAKGFGILTERILGKHGPFIAITILNAFILTTLDTATRVGRYLTEELFRIKNRYCSTFLIVILSSALAFSGQWQKIWPAFGASNQLVAALALFVLSCWLLLKKRSVKYTLWPAAFMLLTTVAALVLQAIKYFLQKDTVLLLVAGFLLILAGFMAYVIVKTFLKRRNG